MNQNQEIIVYHSLKKTARTVHHPPIEYNIISSMREETGFFRKFLEPDSGVLWEVSIAYLINKAPVATTYEDACLDGARGFSIELLNSRCCG